MHATLRKLFSSIRGSQVASGAIYGLMYARRICSATAIKSGRVTAWKAVEAAGHRALMRNNKSSLPGLIVEFCVKNDHGICGMHAYVKSATTFNLSPCQAFASNK